MKFYCYSCGKEEEGFFIYDGKFYIQFECGERRTAEEEEIRQFLKGSFKCRQTSDGTLVCRERKK